MRQLQSYIKTLSQKSQFPDPKQSDADGLLCFGGELCPEILLDAYYHGIFPWPHEGLPLLWFSPKERGILDFKDLHIPKSLQKLRKKLAYRFTVNTAFRDVIQGCSRVPRKGQKGTWITEDMVDAYCELYSLGYCISLECWKDGRLVGGLYGVDIGGVFSGESMFGLESNVSKLCFIETVYYLQSLGRDWMDIQMITSVTKSLGGKYISQDEYLSRLAKSHKLWGTA
jgi:leucyl/phenylalanyl-tRNA--protein transferase